MELEDALRHGAVARACTAGDELAIPVHVLVTLADAIERVRQLHTSWTFKGQAYCEACSQEGLDGVVRWPCRTIEALDGP